MSFCSQIKDDVGNIPIKHTCCRHAYLYGLLYGAAVSDEDDLDVTIPLSPAGGTYDLPAHLHSLIHALLSRDAAMTPVTKGAHRYIQVHVNSRHAARCLRDLIRLPEEEAASETLIRALDFRCEDCATHFLRGLFVAAGTANDPEKSYHLELHVPADGRAEPVRILLSENGYIPGRTDRNGVSRLFYKSADDIQGILSALGAATSIFEFINAQIERDIRNNENRATNCVTENIQRAIRAGGKQLDAIDWLETHHLIPALPPELQYTARLRSDHPEVTLSELAELHNPTITKSGLHHRLEKILAFCEKARAAAGEIAGESARKDAEKN